MKQLGLKVYPFLPFFLIGLVLLVVQLTKNGFLQFFGLLFLGIGLAFLACFVSDKETSRVRFFYSDLLTFSIGSQLLLVFLEWGRHFNDSHYSFLETYAKSPFSYSFIATFLIFWGISVIWRQSSLLVPLVRKGRSLTEYFFQNDTSFYAQWLTLQLFIDARTTHLFKESFAYLENNMTNDWLYLPMTFAIIIASWGIICYLSWSFIALISDVLASRLTLRLVFYSSLLLATLLSTAIQFSIAGEVKVFGIYLFNGAQTFQIFIFTILCLLVYYSVNRYLLATLLLVGIGTLFTVSNHIKFDMRHEPILPSDLSWLNNPKTLLSFVNWQSFLGVGALILIGLFIYLKYRQRFFTGKILISIKTRVIGIVACLFILLSVFMIFASAKNDKIIKYIPFLSALYNRDPLKFQGNTFNAQIRTLSFVWYKQLAAEPMEQPEGYSASKMAEIAQRYEQLAATINQGRTQSLSDQTVIYVLSESFANPARLDSVSVSQDLIPNIGQIMSETTSGLMHSDGYGGGTANMEFQSLFGLPYYNLSSSISTIYTEVLPKMSYLPAISNQFSPENRYVVHMADDYNYSRNIVYNRLGFDTFISIADAEQFDAQKQGLYVSDASTYAIVLDELNAEQSQFFSVITMQNHVPWSEWSPEDVTATSPLLTEAENENLTAYARLLTHTDTATKAFLDQLASIDKKITVVFYGDHLPGLYPQSFFASNPDSQYQTDYFIWSNYDTPNYDYSLLNSSDFPAALLAVTNSKVSPYYALLTEVLNDASVNQTVLDDASQQVATDLKLVQYDLTSGKGYLPETFFNQIE